MVSLTVENYVKAIYQIIGDSTETLASTGELAKALQVSPGSVTSMLRTLGESGLADHQLYGGVRLTESGRRLALRILRRHRLVELFLVKTLGLSWDEVHEEAENLEHAVSDQLVDRMDEYLGFPDRDPHGDPIPKADGSVEHPESQPLNSCQANTKFEMVRVLDQSSAFLKYLSQAGLIIGQRATVIENNPSAGAMVIESNDQRLTLGLEAAGKILVRAD